MYIFNPMDYQTAGLSLLFVSLMEIIIISWNYGEILMKYQDMNIIFLHFLQLIVTIVT